MSRHTKAYIALTYVCIIWGTTYLVTKNGVKNYPSFLFAGLRQSIAGLILMPLALLMNKAKDLSGKNILKQMLVGFLMLSIGNGCVTLGIRHIPSGVSALICSMMPIFAVLFNLLSSRTDHFNFHIGAGLLLGTCGVALIFRHNVELLAQPTYLGGICITIAATASWALGSIINKKNTGQVNPSFNAGMQLFFGGLFMLITSPAVDDYTGFVWWQPQTFLCLGYLIIFGSTLAYSAYVFVLGELPVGIATIYAYINPLIAVVAGYIFLKEELNMYTGLAFATIVASLYLMNRGYRKQHKPVTAEESIVEEAFPEAIPVE